MATWRQFGGLAAVIVVLAGCGIATGTSPTRPPSATPSASESATPAPSEDASAGVTDDPLAPFRDQAVDWQSCGEAECASIEVPLDYADPDGDRVSLAVLRMPATGERRGTLFVNPGGPGGSATDYARAADYIVTPEIRDQFDIVGVDPRGVANSDPVECLTDLDIDGLIALDGTPDDAAEEAAVLDAAVAVGAACEARGGPLALQMGTVDAARDMDIVRSVLGEERLDYLGKSYGSQLGEVYALMFPERVGRMILDGALPLGLDAVEVTKGQADAFEIVLRDFVAFCQLEMGECALSGTVDDGVLQLQEWLASLDSDPIVQDGRVVNEPVAAYAVLSYLYFPPGDYRDLTYALNDAILRRDATELLRLLDARISRDPSGRYLDNSTSAFYAVTCTDRPYTGGVEQVKALAEEWRATAPTFGPALAWGLLSCADWPATAEPLPPGDLASLPPILVVSTMDDPATPYAWGVQMAEELPGSGLLSWDAYQHTAYYQGSECIDEAVDAYLLDGTLPAEGTLCE
jgi:pimeloyl-ACP methyl ester carboxylesterase